MLRWLLVSVGALSAGCIGGAQECELCEIVISGAAPTVGDLTVDLDRGIGVFQLEAFTTSGSVTLTDSSWEINDDLEHDFEVTGLPDPLTALELRFGSAGVVDIDIVLEP